MIIKSIYNCLINELTDEYSTEIFHILKHKKRKQSQYRDEQKLPYTHIKQNLIQIINHTPTTKKQICLESSDHIFETISASMDKCQ